MKQIQMLNKPKQPAFAIIPIKDCMLHWYKCREEFAKVFKLDMNGFYFAHIGAEQNNVTAFINKVEDVIEVEKTQFENTNVNFAVWVSPSKFWLDCSMRMSLYTIFLYAAIDYDLEKDNFESAIFDHEYVKKTESAIKRFLCGFTDFDIKDAKTFAGWVYTFNKKKNFEIKSILTNSKKENCYLGLENLWS